MTRRFAVLLSCAAASSLAIACSSAPKSIDDVSGNGTATLAERTSVIEGDLADSAEVQSDKLVFPASAWSTLSAHKAGDILVGDRASAGDKNPNGFLRRVMAVTQENGAVVVTTQPATLQEAVETLSFNTKLTTPPLGADGPKTQAGAGTVGTLGTGKTISVIDFSGKQLLDVTETVKVDQSDVGFRMFATVNKGTVDFTPSWDVGADVGFLKLKSFHATATGTIDAALEIDAGVKLTSNLDSATFTKLVAQKIFKAKDATLADYDLKLGKVKIGPLPIPMSAHFTTTLACDFAWGGGAEVVVGGTANAVVTAGVKYENGALSPVFSKSATLQQTGPSWTLDGLVKIKCTVQPKFDLKLWDLASGEIWANGYVDVGGSLTCGGPDANGNQLGNVSGAAGAGVSAGVKAKVDVFGLVKWQKECTLFDFDTSADFQRSFVLPGGKNATCTGTEAYKRDVHTAAPDLCFGGGNGGNGGGGGGANNGGGADAGGGANNACTHDECTVGDPLGAQCSPCTQKVCAQDPYCCDTFWGPSCFAQVANVCGYKCQ